MALLSVQNVSKYFGERALFTSVSFEADARGGIGLVGSNGCGKTTLFRILTGDCPPDSGGVVRARELRLGYMEQHACGDSGRTLWDEVESVFEPVIRMEKELAGVTALLGGEKSGDAELIERQHDLTERFAAAGGLTYQSRVRSTLTGLGFDEAAFSQPVESLSGGQRSKAAMGKLLLSDANFLLLDEPTNHLDIGSVQWLEEFLRGYPGAYIVISHDRYFLDRVTARTMEFSGGRLFVTNGNYSAHRALRDHQRETDEKHYKTAMREVKRMEEMITRFRQFNREKSIRAAESKQKMLDKMMDGIEAPESDEAVIRFDFSVRHTGGNEVLGAEALSMSFPGRPLFKNVDFQLRRGDRVFLLGPNGCGKTTLLRGLCGELEPETGEVRLGAKVSVGYYDQTQSGLDEGKTALDEVWDAYSTLTQTEIRNAMAAFLFRADDVYKPVSLLSGGERARLLLLKLMLARDNLLLLDEPTNHLDIASREALEDALSGYDGTLFIVSHDRYFINRMANRVMWLEADGCRVYEGNYDTYLEKTTPKAAERPDDKPNTPARDMYRQRKERESTRRRLNGAIQRQEQAITELEAAIAAVQEQLSDEAAAADYNRIIALTAELEKKNTMLDGLVAEWESLHEQLEQLESVTD